MKQFILGNKPYSQTDREDIKQHYLSIGCEEVQVLYNGNFLNPIWNGSEFIESATPEEIAEQENQQKQELKRQAHEELLKTDWYVVRFVERGIEIPKEILEQRQLIRNSI